MAGAFGKNVEITFRYVFIKSMSELYPLSPVQICNIFWFMNTVLKPNLQEIHSVKILQIFNFPFIIAHEIQ